MNAVKKYLKSFFRQFGYDIIDYEKEQTRRLQEKTRAEEWHSFSHGLKLLELILKRDESSGVSKFTELHFLKSSLPNVAKSKSQIFQDLFVLYMLNGKRNGFFIEFGATNGESLSNTYLLEKNYGWKGILSEPGMSWHQSLKNNRQCTIDFRCVWSKSGEILRFNESENAAFSTIEMFNNQDYNAEIRKKGHVYSVATISLNDLLKTHNAPETIDYLSIDTEGSEFEILNAFDFNRFKIRVITVEHNYTPMREKIFSLLKSNGYKRVFESISYFDDWYVKSELLA